ncbi:barstar family protein [Chryseobacterium sp. OSA05B]|uniref:barstar family protein n=1 Tax=Chryseobacterium sp. OSA05B TaxID=2862650 RepID=UPI001CBD669D|nr:barstar family protein [Chryseobacterium sp. OSA05B]
MKTIYIDFTDIGDYEDFYAQLKEKLTLPEYFGDNLDALSDVITGELEMPLDLEFVNMTVDQLEIFEDLLTTLEDAEDDMEDFSFTYYLEQYEDDENENEDQDQDGKKEEI